MVGLIYGLTWSPWERAVIAGLRQVCVSLHRVGGVCRERQFGHPVGRGTTRFCRSQSKDRLGLKAQTGGADEVMSGGNWDSMARAGFR
jgi:hypothetical protein